MNKINFLLTLFFLSLFSFFSQAQEEFKSYGDIPTVKAILEKSGNGTLRKEIDSGSDATVRFMIALNNLLLINSVQIKCRGSHFMNIGYTGSDGTIYSSGISPDSISDEADRRNYKMKIQKNNENILIVRKITTARREMIELTRSELSKIENAYKEPAAHLFETVSR